MHSVSTYLKTAAEKRWMKRWRVEAVEVEMDCAERSQRTFCACSWMSLGSEGLRRVEKSTWLVMDARLFASVLLSTSCRAEMSEGSRWMNLEAYCHEGLKRHNRFYA